MKVLWLVSWYPNKLSPYDGDFLKRHAEATSLYEEVEVLFVVKDPEGVITQDILIEEMQRGRLKETIIYYHVPKNSIRAIEKIASYRKYKKIYREHIKEKFQTVKPSLINVHIGMKAGIPALWAKKEFKVPLLISDQWTGLLQNALDNFDHLPFYTRYLWRKIVKSADSLSAVSAFLATAIKKRFDVQSCRIIPNVVDTNIFYLEENRQNKFIHFLHISTLVNFKNPRLIIEAFALVVKQFPEATLTIVGPKDTLYALLIEELHLTRNITLLNEMPQTLLVKEIRKSDAFILYSLYETFGCVIIEANACGLPVIVSDIPVMREIVKEGENGFFAPPENAEGLASTLITLITRKPVIDSARIAANTVFRYSYSVVGKMFSDWYAEVVGKGN